jgi:V/A-type H+-transporting ATPase subunit A
VPATGSERSVENSILHKIMVPFMYWKDDYTIKKIATTQETIPYVDTVAVMALMKTVREVSVTMVQKWPVKKALTSV